ncbi:MULTISPECIES: cell division protein ZapA [Treponema]|jgi:cell division protein ZapA|uniref:Cell division protein ZapA n=1 Tax=Treponema rectale TaxID=744512 RepID=A0A840SEU4_9SPIR|nr:MULTISPECIES: cell division protein ZapA [Treponema]MBB5217972.1 cell division protein ZapA [Treponema rectale]MBE6353520.1 cell division protein ZapA [Treponema sp.]MBO6176559.1 cell division protein ZapA [Treponema sp.]QOS40311.1 cell division protein ZapA [Treponema rectale]
MGKIQINLLGSSFTIQAKEDEDYLKKLVDYYKEITRTISSTGRNIDPLQVSIIAGITLVDELYKEKKRNATCEKTIQGNTEEDLKAQQIALTLLDRLDEALDE